MNEYDKPKEQGGRSTRPLVITIVVLLAVIGALSAALICTHDGKAGNPAPAGSTPTDTIATDSVAKAEPADTAAEEPEMEEIEEGLDIAKIDHNSSKQLLATYWYGDILCKFYWDTGEQQLSICDASGTCLKTHRLEDIFLMTGAKGGVDARVYNHHVYFVASRGANGAGWVFDNMILYVAPLEDNALHVLVNECAADYVFSKNSVRVNHPTVSNEETATCTADFEYADHWQTVPLR